MSVRARARASAYTLLAPLAVRGMVLDLAAMRAALSAFGDPQQGLRCVHVAGTNGKGSVSAMVDSALRAAGVRSAAYTSPHLHRFVERFRIDGEAADEDETAAVAAEVLAAMSSGRIPTLTFFEAATLVGWLLFRRHGVTVPVMEVGLGGRLDATTVCAPRVTAITRIAWDHEAILGDTLGAIAREKAGILKPGVPCVLGPDLREGEARESVESVARGVGTPLVDAPVATVLPDGRVRVPYGEAMVTVRPALPGAHQAGNVAVAAGICALLAGDGVPVDAEAFARGIAGVRWPARLEVLGDVVLDAAHNPDGVAALVHALPGLLAGRRVGALVFGASRDKPWRAMLDAVVPWALPERRYFGAAEIARAVEPAALAGYAGGVPCGSAAEALASARAVLQPGEVVLACGSIYFVAGVRASALGITEDPRIAL